MRRHKFEQLVTLTARYPWAAYTGYGIVITLTMLTGEENVWGVSYNHTRRFEDEKCEMKIKRRRRRRRRRDILMMKLVA